MRIQHMGNCISNLRNHPSHTVGNIFSHDNAVVSGKRVAQMATTIHRPDVGYAGT
jgi:hypothetical protein